MGFSSKIELGRFLGIKPNNISTWEKEGIPPKHLFKVSENSEKTISWLKTGKGQMRPIIPEAKPTARIRVLARVSAGTPEYSEDDIIEYISLPDVPNGADAIIVKGNSMTPNIKDGDYAIFLPNQKSDIKSGDVLLVLNEWGEAMIKRYRVKGDGEQWLVSDNPEYPPVKPNEGFQIIGKVIKAWRPLVF